MTVQGNDIAIRGPAMRAQGFWRDETLLHHLDRAVARHPGKTCLLYTSPSPRDRTRSRMPSSA